MWNHAQICSWNRPVLSKEGKVSCSWKQHELLMGFKRMTYQLRVRRATHWSTRPPLQQYLSKSNNQCLRTTDSYNNHSIYCLCFLWTNKQNIQVSVFLFISKISSFSAQLCYSFRLFVYWLLIINNSWSWTAEQQDHVQWAIQSMWIVIDTKKGFTSYEMFNNATCNIKHMTASVSYASSID